MSDKLSNMSNKLSDLFDFYAVMGVAAPGAALLLAVSLLLPKVGDIFISQDLGLGNLGLFLIIAYVAGQFVQGLGFVLEWVWWLAWGGRPTDWIRTRKKRTDKDTFEWVRKLDPKILISDGQIKKLKKQLPGKLDLEEAVPIAEKDPRKWHGIVRQMHSAVAAHSRITRVEMFNAIYGLNRGMAALLLVATGVILIRDVGLWRWSVTAAVVATVFLLQMHLFGRFYATELFVQFIQLPGAVPEEACPEPVEVAKGPKAKGPKAPA